MDALARARVIVFGVGGVGSWCAEALARVGVGEITVVDSDTVAVSNINRQLVADFHTVGSPKVTIMLQRILSVSPDCRVHGVCAVYDEATADTFDLDSHDVVVDAIDSVASKALLMLRATRCRHARLVSSMGAALKTDIFSIRRARSLDEVTGCPLARAVRQRFRRLGVSPSRRFPCVFSPQLVQNAAETTADLTANGLKRVNGTMVTTTAAFGLALAQLAIETALRRLAPASAAEHQIQNNP